MFRVNHPAIGGERAVRHGGLGVGRWRGGSILERGKNTPAVCIWRCCCLPPLPSGVDHLLPSGLGVLHLHGDSEVPDYQAFKPLANFCSSVFTVCNYLRDSVALHDFDVRNKIRLG